MEDGTKGKKSTERKEQEKYHKEETGRAKQAREKVKQQTRIALPWCGGVGARQAPCLGPVTCTAQLCPAHPPPVPRPSIPPLMMKVALAAEVPFPPNLIFGY